MYFPPRSEPLDLSADRLHGLRLSLNTPVVSIEELPVGPARAAIAVHEEIDGRPNLTVGVRSLKGGESVLFSLEGDLREHSSLAVGIDAALSFGESMGFLFDEDEIGEARTDEARSRALGLWLERMESAPGASEAGSQSTAATGSAPPSMHDESFEVEGLDDEEVLLLEELAELGDDPPGPLGEEPDGIDSQPPEPGPREEDSDSDRAGGTSEGAAPVTARGSPVPLSKFRGRAPSKPRPQRLEEPSPVAARSSRGGNGAVLGRLKLVKRRKGGADAAPPKPSAIRRLLSSF